MKKQTKRKQKNKRKTTSKQKLKKHIERNHVNVNSHLILEASKIGNHGLLLESLHNKANIAHNDQYGRNALHYNWNG